MDVFVSHGQSSLTTAKRLGDLGWGPYREMAPAHVFLVEDVGKSSDLVFLVVKKSLECHDVGSHQVTDGVFGGVEGCGLGEDDPPAVLVPLRQHKDVASLHQVRYVSRIVQDSWLSNFCILRKRRMKLESSRVLRMWDWFFIHFRISVRAFFLFLLVSLSSF